MLLLCWDYLPWMTSCYWNLLLKTRAFIVSFANYLPTFIAIADNTIRPILKNLQKPTSINNVESSFHFLFVFFSPNRKEKVYD